MAPYSSQDITYWLRVTHTEVCNLIDPCFRDASLLSILSSSVLGLVLGFCGTGGNLMAMHWPFLRVGIRAWLLGLCSWSQLLLQQPCRKVAGDVLQVRAPPARKHPLGLR